MSRTCRVCSHPERIRIDQALASTTPIAHIAHSFDLSRHSLDRHKRSHLVSELAYVLQNDPELGNLDLLAQARSLYSRSSFFLSLAEAENNFPSIVTLHREARRDLEFLAKILLIDDRLAITHEQLAVTMQMVVDVVTRHVTDRETLVAINTELRSLLRSDRPADGRERGGGRGMSDGPLPDKGGRPLPADQAS